MIETEENALYSLTIEERRSLLIKAGFSGDSNRVWTHPDGRAIGEAVISALVDAAFLKYLGFESLAVGNNQ